MKILFLQEDINVTPNAVGGASALIHSHLQQLLATQHEISVLVINTSANLEQLNSCVNSLEKLSPKTRFFSVDHVVLEKPETTKFARLEYYLFKHSTFFPILSKKNLYFFQKKVHSMNEDFIWAEHFLPTYFAIKTTSSPVIYSHHDWLWVLDQLKWQNKKQSKVRQFRNRYIRHMEESLVKKVHGCVSGSVKDVNFFKMLGKNLAGYLPTVYENVTFPRLKTGEKNPRIVHLGGMGATANRLGLERFLDVVWGQTLDDPTLSPQLWVVGDLNLAPKSLLYKLDLAGAICTGFVSDLSKVLRPYDIHIIPWEHSTGTRTRLPIAFSYGQVLVATKNAVMGYREVKNNTNCILVSELSDMAKRIKELVQDDRLRCFIGNAARETFQAAFTFEAQHKEFVEYINQVQDSVGVEK